MIERMCAGHDDAFVRDAVQLGCFPSLSLVPDKRQTRDLLEHAFVGQVVPARHRQDARHAELLCQPHPIALGRAEADERRDEDDVGTATGQTISAAVRDRYGSVEPAQRHNERAARDVSARKERLEAEKQRRCALPRPRPQRRSVAELGLEIAKEVDRKPNSGPRFHPGVLLLDELCVREAGESAVELAERLPGAVRERCRRLAFLDHYLDRVTSLEECFEKAGERAVEVRREHEEEQPKPRCSRGTGRGRHSRTSVIGVRLVSGGGLQALERLSATLRRRATW